MAFGTRIEELRWEIRDAEDTIRYNTREVFGGMPQTSPADMAQAAETARVRRDVAKSEFAALVRTLIGGDPTFGGGTFADPHPSKRKGTGMDRIAHQFYLSEGGQLPELLPSGDPGSVLNKYNMTRYFLQGDVAEIMLNPDLAPLEKEAKLFPVLVRLEQLTTKEASLRASLKKVA